MGDILSLFLHLDKSLQAFLAAYGAWTYGILFLIILCETGLVITPFLPGDSLLFAAGALSAVGDLNLPLLLSLLWIAAVVGDALNFWIGHVFGERVLAHPRAARWIRPEHVQRTRDFYAKYGAKTIVFARFFPIVRTFAPFIAGIARMPYGIFVKYNIIGGALWVALFTLAGYFFGGLPAVQEHFSLVIFGIILVSLLPALSHVFTRRKN